MEKIIPSFVITDNLESNEFDAIVVISTKVENIPFERVKNPLSSYVAVDKSGEKGVFVVPSDLPAKKIVFSGTGALTNDHDDVTSFAKAAKVIKISPFLN